jgi:outer membrane protein OmpA-like peptidoglycan-associated protein/tetratricopeptide (TPR) repeat protein
MKKHLLAALFAAFSIFGQAQLTEHEVRQMTQTASEQQLVTECSRMLQEDYFYYAEIVIDRLLQINPQSANYHYRKGYIVLDSRQDFETAMPHLFMAISNVKKNYDMYSAKELSAPTDAYYHLARCYHLDEQLDKAKEFYQKFLNETSGKSELIPKAQLRLIQCDVAKELIAKPKTAIVTNIGPNVNTVYPEYAPVISLDGTSLYFTSRRQWEDQSTDDYRDPQLNQYPEDIYLSIRDSSLNWSKPDRLSFCEGKLNEASVSISADERMIYTYEDRTGNGDIYYSDFQRNEFQYLKKLDNNTINTKYWETHVSVTPDGQQMYFVSDRPGGYGKRDLYRIVKLPNGKWSEPINLGPKINTEHDEDSPFIAVDNKTLYFSSNGSTSMGEFDIFVSIRDDNDNWSDPINLGYPINSTGDDVFYTTTADGLTGYLSSFRKKGFGEKDIYRIDNDYMGIKNAAVLRGKILTSDGSPIPEGIWMELTCNNCDDKRKIDLLPRLRDGQFFSNLTPCREYSISFYADQTKDFVYTENFSTKCNAGYEEIYKEVMFDVERKRIIPFVRYSLDGTISDAKTGERINGAVVEIEIKATGEVLERMICNEQGYFISKYLDKAAYGDKIEFSIKVSKDEYLTQHFDFKTTLGDQLDIHLAYVLEKPEVGIDLAQVLQLNPIYFDLDKSDIRPDAEIELNKIIEIMNDNPKIKIELGSHTDCRSSFDYNLKLSDRRALSSAEYIQQRITNPERIYGKGYGESQLVNDCECEGKVVSKCSEEEHQQNRRTEFRIVQ